MYILQNMNDSLGNIHQCYRMAFIHLTSLMLPKLAKQLSCYNGLSEFFYEVRQTARTGGCSILKSNGCSVYTASGSLLSRCLTCVGCWWGVSIAKLLCMAFSNGSCMYHCLHSLQPSYYFGHHTYSEHKLALHTAASALLLYLDG